MKNKYLLISLIASVFFILTGVSYSAQSERQDDLLFYQNLYANVECTSEQINNFYATLYDLLVSAISTRFTFDEVEDFSDWYQLYDSVELNFYYIYARNSIENMMRYKSYQCNTLYFILTAMYNYFDRLTEYMSFVIMINETDILRADDEIIRQLYDSYEKSIENYRIALTIIEVTMEDLENNRP